MPQSRITLRDVYRCMTDAKLFGRKIGEVSELVARLCPTRVGHKEPLKEWVWKPCSTGRRPPACWFRVKIRLDELSVACETGEDEGRAGSELREREVPGRPDALDLADGLSILSVPKREPGGDIDRFCVGVEDFEPERVASAIRGAGPENDLRVGRDSMSVRDPDCISVQISRPDWGG